jgi:hypothetical protein
MERQEEKISFIENSIISLIDFILIPTSFIRNAIRMEKEKNPLFNTSIGRIYYYSAISLGELVRFGAYYKFYEEFTR